MNKEFNNSLAENKVLILYTIKTIPRELTNNDLFKIIYSINEINYFYFGDILSDLISSKLLVNYSKDNHTFLKLSPKGENSLELTLDILPGIVKLKANNIFKAELSKIAEEQAITAEYIPESETDYTVKCQIVENNKVIFELKTFAGSNEHAKKIADNWKNNANNIYPEILNLLNKN
jgi:predicted transcriptional regulator